MKKAYQNPNIRIIKAGPQHMIAATQVGIGSNYNGSSTIESRERGVIWDDEEE